MLSYKRIKITIKPYSKYTCTCTFFSINITEILLTVALNTIKPNINIFVWQWFQDAISCRINVSGPLIQVKALKFASYLI